MMSWRKENPDWDKDWSKGCATASREFKWTGEAASSGWNEVLDRASKQPGSNVIKIAIISKYGKKKTFCRYWHKSRSFWNE